jgi:cytochrome c oxidase cbb3-type subunit 3
MRDGSAANGMGLRAAVTLALALAAASPIAGHRGGDAPRQNAAQPAGSGRENRHYPWPVPDPQSVERGKARFAQLCGRCHANNAAGTPNGSNLTRSALVRHDADGSRIANLVSTGVPAKGKAPMTVSPEQMSDIVAFIQSTIQTYDRSSEGAPPADYPVEKLLTGDPAAGRTFFNGAGGCASCHSPTGDLAGIATRYSPIELQARFLLPRSKTPRTATITPPTGPAVTGRLLRVNNYEVAIAGPDDATQTWPANTVSIEIHDPLAAHRALLPKYTDADVHNMFAYLWTLK